MHQAEAQTLGDDFNETEIGPIPTDWAVVQIGDVLSDATVKVKDQSEISPGELQVLSLSKNDGLVLQSEHFKKRIALEDIGGYKLVRRGWLVYNPYVIWEGAIHALRDRDYGVVSPAYQIWRPDVNAHIFFLDYLFRTPWMLDTFLMHCAGTVKRRRSISRRDFESIRIPLPPLDEQRKIARVLNALQAEIAAQDQLIAAAQEVKRALMARLFTYGPGRDPAPTKETEIGELPEPWVVVRIGDVIEDTQYGLSQKAYEHGMYPILGMAHLVDGYVRPSDLKYVDLKDDDFEKFRLRSGDVLFNRTNSLELVGKTAIFQLEGDYVFASYLVRVVADHEHLQPEYLNHCLNTDAAQGRLKMIATRAVSQSNINATKLKNFQIPLPPVLEQEEVSAILRTVDRKIEAERQRKGAVQANFDAMLHELMTGRIRLKEVDI